MAGRLRNRHDWFGEQPVHVLRGLILTVSIFLLCMGIGMIVLWMSNQLNLYQPEMSKAAVLLKLQSEKTQGTMADMFSMVGLAGYGTVNVGTLAVCAASGRRRVHSVAGLVGAGLGAFVYLSVLLNFFRPRIAAISETLNQRLYKYFRAFQITGDVKYLNQIHLEKACCGLQGVADFTKWRRELPSSCCGLDSGKCEIEEAAALSCKKAFEQLSGDDGLFNLGYVAQILGISCIVLCLFLAILIFFPDSDAIENMGKLGKRIDAAERRAAGEELKNETKRGGRQWTSPSTRGLQEEWDSPVGAARKTGKKRTKTTAKLSPQGRAHALYSALKTTVEGMKISSKKLDSSQIQQLLEARRIQARK